MATLSERAHWLTSKYLSGCIENEELRELETLLHEHEEARLAYLNEIHLHGALFQVAESLPASEIVEDTGAHPDVHFATGLQKLVRDRERSEHIRKPNSKRHMSALKAARHEAARRKLWLPSLLAACVLASVTLYLTVGRGAGLTKVSPEAGAVGKVIYVTELVKSAAERPVLVRGSEAPKELSAGMELRAGDRIQTRGKPDVLAPVAQTQVEIWGALVDLAEATDLSVSHDPQDPFLNIEAGLIYVEAPANLHVKTDFANLLIDAGGAYFDFSLNSDAAKVRMQKGSASLQSSRGVKQDVKALQECAVKKGAAVYAPQPILVSQVWRGRKGWTVAGTPTPTPSSETTVFRDTFTELVQPYKPFVNGHVPEVGLRWEVDENTASEWMVPFFIYTGDVPRGKVAVPSVNSYNFTNPRPDGSSWSQNGSVRRSYLAITAQPLSPDYKVQLTLREVDSANSKTFWYVTARRTAPGTFYGAGWYHGSLNPDTYIFKVINGVYTQLASGNCDLSSNGRVVALQVSGDTLTFSKDGVARLTAAGGNAITQAGTGGWGAGNIRNATDVFSEGGSVDDFSIVSIPPNQPPVVQE